MFTISAYTTTNRRLFIANTSDLDRAQWHLNRLDKHYGPWTLISADVCRERETTPLMTRTFAAETALALAAD